MNKIKFRRINFTKIFKTHLESNSQSQLEVLQSGGVEGSPGYSANKFEFEADDVIT